MNCGDASFEAFSLPRIKGGSPRANEHIVPYIEIGPLGPTVARDSCSRIPRTTKNQSPLHAWPAGEVRRQVEFVVDYRRWFYQYGIIPRKREHLELGVQFDLFEATASIQSAAQARSDGVHHPAVSASSPLAGADSRRRPGMPFLLDQFSARVRTRPSIRHVFLWLWELRICLGQLGVHYQQARERRCRIPIGKPPRR